MEHVEVEATIAAPLDSVWERYTDHGRWSEWAGVGPSRRIRDGAPDPDGVGARRSLGPGVFAAIEEVLEFEPPRRMVYTVRRGPLPMRRHRGEVVFEDLGRATHIVWRCDFESTFPGLGWLTRLAVTRVFRRALAGLGRDLGCGPGAP
ncbi:MAG: SRPBCC family protein [Myxococcota bacterium]